MKSCPTRLLAAAIIARWQKTANFPGRLIPDNVAERALLMELVLGVTRWKRLLEWVASRYVRRTPQTELHALLLVGLYQLLIMTQIECYAAVNETVASAKLKHGASGAAFINAVLRKLLREKETVLRLWEKQPLGLRESHPDILTRRWIQAFGRLATTRLCQWNNTRAEVSIYINSLRISRADFLKCLQPHGIELKNKHFHPSGCLLLPHGWRVETLPGYREGWFLALDASVTEAVAHLRPRPGERVLDACAAPGGKTFLIAEAMRKEGELVALEFHTDRMARLRENMQRLGCADFVNIIQGDIRKAKTLFKTPFDCVLLDLPCTNTGVLRRRPDARWRFSEARLAKMVQTQRVMLSAAAQVLKPGGRLVYSTCSLEAEEDESQIAGFLGQNPEYECVGEYKIFPPENCSDGAYGAVLQLNR